jgi:hypothetical protein
LLTWGNLSDAEQLPHARNMVEYWNYCRDLVRSAMRAQSDDLPGDLVRLQKEGPRSATTRSPAFSTAFCSPAMRPPRR